MVTSRKAARFAPPLPQTLNRERDDTIANDTIADLLVFHPFHILEENDVEDFFFHNVNVIFVIVKALVNFVLRGGW